MRTTTLTRKGRVTIPTEIRKALGLVEGDRLEVQLDSETVCLRRAESVITRTAGIFSNTRAQAVQPKRCARPSKQRLGWRPRRGAAPSRCLPCRAHGRPWPHGDLHL
jgi:AbrB family looped-hinge helix DNA binding protein